MAESSRSQVLEGWRKVKPAPRLCPKRELHNHLWATQHFCWFWECIFNNEEVGEQTLLEISVIKITVFLHVLALMRTTTWLSHRLEDDEQILQCMPLPALWWTHFIFHRTKSPFCKLYFNLRTHWLHVHKNNRSAPNKW